MVNYFGEFGGGVIDFKIVWILSENFFSVKLGIGFNIEMYLIDGLFVDGSDIDWFGFDDGFCDLLGLIVDIVV